MNCVHLNRCAAAVVPFFEKPELDMPYSDGDEHVAVVADIHGIDLRECDHNYI